MEIKEIDIDDIKVIENIRQKSLGEDLNELMASIKQSGLMQPIGVREKRNGYTLIWGYRRVQAFKKLGYKTIPAVIFVGQEDNLSEEDFLIMNASENIHRKNVDMIELGRICNLLHKQGLSYAEIAVRLSIPLVRVENSINQFFGVPKNYRDKISLLSYGKKKVPGKIGSSIASSILGLRGAKGKDRERVFDWARKEGKGHMDIRVLNHFLKNEEMTVKQAMKASEQYQELSIKLAVNRKIYADILNNKGYRNSKEIVKKLLNKKFPGLVF